MMKECLNQHVIENQGVLWTVTVEIDVKYFLKILAFGAISYQTISPQVNEASS